MTKDITTKRPNLNVLDGDQTAAFGFLEHKNAEEEIEANFDECHSEPFSFFVAMKSLFVLITNVPRVRIFGGAFALLLALQAHADTLLGKVINVADGDTITVLDGSHTQHKIRLAGVDAPEKKQAFGNVSKQSLAEQVAGQPVAVEWSKSDKYGRKVGKVLLAGMDANLEQVKRGLAWHYKQYQREQSPTDQQSYAAAEIEARAAKLGLWRDADPVPPWEFRHKGKP